MSRSDSREDEMRTKHHVWIATLLIGLSLGGCLPCVPGVRVDTPRTAACAASTDGAMHGDHDAPPPRAPAPEQLSART